MKLPLLKGSYLHYIGDAAGLKEVPVPLWVLLKLRNQTQFYSSGFGVLSPGHLLMDGNLLDTARMILWHKPSLEGRSSAESTTFHSLPFPAGGFQRGRTNHDPPPRVEPLESPKSILWVTVPCWGLEQNSVKLGWNSLGGLQGVPGFTSPNLSIPLSPQNQHQLGAKLLLPMLLTGTRLCAWIQAPKSFSVLLFYEWPWAAFPQQSSGAGFCVSLSL